MDNALEIHAHYSKLFEAFAVLPLDDIKRELRSEALKHFQSGEYHDWRKMLQRMSSYLEKSNLDGQRRESIKVFVNIEEVINNIELSYPECRMLLRESDRTELRARFIELIGGQNIFLAERWVMGIDKRTPDDIKALCPPALDEDTKNRTEAIKQRLARLDKWEVPPTHAVLAKTKGGDFVTFTPCPAPAATQATPPAAQSAPVVALTPVERALVAPFTLDEAAGLAHYVGLTDASGAYCLGPRKLGAVVGFCLALKHAGKLRGAVDDLTAVVSPRLGVAVKTRKTTTDIAKQYYALTEKALTRLKQMR